MDSETFHKSIEEEIADEFSSLSFGNDFTKDVWPVPMWMATQFLGGAFGEKIGVISKIDRPQMLLNGGFDTGLDEIIHEINNGTKTFDDLIKMYPIKEKDLVLDDWRDASRRLHKIFFREEVAQEYLIEKRWPNGIICPWCGNDYNNYVIQDMKRYKCSHCLRKFSLLGQTIFRNTNLPLVKWLSSIYLMTQNKHKIISSIKLAECIKTPQCTAWRVGKKIKDNIGNHDFILLNNGLFEFKSKLYTQ